MAARYSAHAPDIECEGCANSIRNSLGRVNGVQRVEVDIEQKVIDVEYDAAEVSEAVLADKLTRAGFPPARS